VNEATLFVQQRTHRAGAQTCLARLVRHAGMRQWRPVVLCSGPGWLTEACAEAGVPTLLVPFPSSRSLAGRLLLNRRFARRVAGELSRRGMRVGLVHGNDHWEGLLGLALAEALGVRSALFLRSPGMRREDYVKYRCGRYDLLGAVGDELRARVQGWDPERTIELIYDGIEEGEFAPPKATPDEFPRRILVLGSPLDWKGWADLAEAVRRWEASGEAPALTFDLTGSAPDPAKNDLGLDRIGRCRFNFLGRVENFRELVCRYDLAVNPTRMESFGMAAVETVALGVPLLSSRTGIIEQVIRQPEFLFPPSDPAALAEAMGRLHRNWPHIRFDAADCQRNIRAKFTIDSTVRNLTTAYRRLL
jgi:glycosyltransferase involved in cell wall biosynthesis